MASKAKQAEAKVAIIKGKEGARSPSHVHGLLCVDGEGSGGHDSRLHTKGARS